LRLTHDAPPVGVAYGNELAEGIEGRLDIACLFGNDHQAIGRGVLGEHDPEAIEDTAALRCHEADADPILIGQHLVTLSLDRLQIVQPARQCSEQDRLTAGQQRDAARNSRARLFSPLSRPLPLFKGKLPTSRMTAGRLPRTHHQRP
jgi:hypothetical protein